MSDGGARIANRILWFAAALLLPSWTASAQAEPDRLDTIRDVFARLHSCWKPPPPSRANPIDITVVVSFNREGAILGHPKITHESEHATDNDRLIYRMAVMEALQRCTPLPFTEALGGADRRPAVRGPIQITAGNLHPNPTEHRAWLTPKIL